MTGMPAFSQLSYAPMTPGDVDEVWALEQSVFP